MFLLDTRLSEYMRVYGEEEGCLEEIYHCKWPRGFICPYCSHNDGYRLSRVRMMECSSCGRQSSITANTIFQDSKIPLIKWFLAIYLVAHDKGGVNAMRL
jgi:transposase-like protein